MAKVITTEELLESAIWNLQVARDCGVTGMEKELSLDFLRQALRRLDKVIENIEASL